MEALPVELLRCANLIRKPEIIRPPFLFRAPAAAPTKVEDVRRALRSRFDGSYEVRAPRCPRHRHPVDIEVRLGREHLHQESLHFDPRDVRVDADSVGYGFTTRAVRSDISLELLMSPRLREQHLQLLQNSTLPNSELNRYGAAKYGTSRQFSAPLKSFSRRYVDIILHARPIRPARTVRLSARNVSFASS